MFLSKKFLLLILLGSFFVTTPTYAINLNVHDADLRSIIMLVAKTGGLNVAIDDSVKGTISISLDNINPLGVLEIISKAKNLQLINERGVYIVTVASDEVMQSYVIPIKFGDSNLIKKAIITTLNPDREYLPSSATRVKNSDGSYTYRYTYRNDGEGNSHSNERKNIKREDRVFVNPEVNAIVLYGTPAEYERVKNLLKTIDVELKQVSVEAKILAIDKDATKNLGVEWMWSSIPQYNSDGSITHYEKYDFTHINALVTNGKAKILSRPNVTTIQGREAVINVGSSVPVPMTSTTNSTVTTSITYRDAGIILKYTPRVNTDGTITATIHTEVSTPQYVEDMNAYRFNTRSADTTVTVNDGEPMIIGGLIGAEEAKSISKIPFLGDLPILGALFRNHRNSKTESELIIFLTAHVINGDSHEILSDKSLNQR